MSLSATAMSVAGALAGASAILAGATIWVLVNDPIPVADAIGQGDPIPLVRLLADAVVDALRAVLSYL
jgi:hypothetical protein